MRRKSTAHPSPSCRGAARRGRRPLHTRIALRCVSKHEGANISTVLIPRDARTRVAACGTVSALLGMRTTDRVRIITHGFSPSRFLQTADLVPAARFCARVLLLSLHAPPEGVGGAPRVVRVLARHPLGLHVTRQARRWRGALRPSEDARLPALHRGGFWLRCRAFPHQHLRRIGPSELLAPGRSARRRRSVPPGAAVTSRCRGTPRLAPRSGRLENTPLNEHGCERSSAVASRSQYP